MERNAMERFTKNKFAKVPLAYPFDFVIIGDDDAIIAGVEVKVRSYAMGKLPDLFVSALKLQRMSDWYLTTGIETYLLVDALDGLFYVRICSHRLCVWSSKGYMRMAGRTDRDDPQDVEACFHIPINEFSKRAT
jgi:hypothetical protein